MFQEWPMNKQKKVGPGNRLGYAVSWPNSPVNSLSMIGLGTKGHTLSETGISGSTGSSCGSTEGFLNTTTNVNSASNYTTSSLDEYMPIEHSLLGSYVPHQDIPVKDNTLNRELMSSPLFLPHHLQNVLTHQPSQPLVQSQISSPAERAFQFPNSSVPNVDAHEPRASRDVGVLSPKLHQSHTLSHEARVVGALTQQHPQQQQQYCDLNAGRMPMQHDYVSVSYTNIAQNTHGWPPPLTSQSLSSPVQSVLRSFNQSYEPPQTATSIYQDAANAEGGIPPASGPHHQQVAPLHMHQNYTAAPLLAQQQLLSRSFPTVASLVDTQHRVAQSQQTMMGGDRQNVYLQCSETSIPAAVRHEQPPTAGATGRDGFAAAAAAASSPAAMRLTAAHEEMSIPAHLDFHLDNFL